jgi:hypothetical protein
MAYFCTSNASACRFAASAKSDRQLPWKPAADFRGLLTVESDPNGQNPAYFFGDRRICPHVKVIFFLKIL